MKNLVRERWLKGEASLGAISHMLSPVAVEAMGAAGMDSRSIQCLPGSKSASVYLLDEKSEKVARA